MYVLIELHFSKTIFLDNRKSRSLIRLDWNYSLLAKKIDAYLILGIDKIKLGFYGIIVFVGIWDK